MNGDSMPTCEHGKGGSRTAQSIEGRYRGRKKGRFQTGLFSATLITTGPISRAQVPG